MEQKKTVAFSFLNADGLAQVRIVFDSFIEQHSGLKNVLS